MFCYTSIVTLLIFLVHLLNIFYSQKCDPYPDGRLILTPLLLEGQIQAAQNAALVNFSDFQNTSSYAGFFTVNEKYNSNLFFWFFPSVNHYHEAPVILWLQGGPGCSSLFGLFVENGPFALKPSDQLEFRNFTWNQNHSILYIDNPVGSGFSYTHKFKGYAFDEVEVRDSLYSALLQFFTMFPDIQKNKFFIFGESYAGKYIPHICYKIHFENPTASIKINLQGFGIGDGVIDPLNQMNYSNFLYQTGFIDLHTKEEMEIIENSVSQNILNINWMEASYEWHDILFLFKNKSGGISGYNYINDRFSNFSAYITYLNRTDVRNAIHVGMAQFNSCSPIVYELMNYERMQSVAPLLAYLLSYYRVLIYNGQLDLIIPYTLATNFLQKLHFASAKEYANATRHVWRVDGEVAGYSIVAGNLTQVLVRNAGHMVPADQPKWMLDLLNHFVFDVALNESFV